MDNIKRFIADDTIFYSLLIGLVALTAYGLGKYSATLPRADLGESHVVLVEQAPPEKAVEITAATTTAQMTLVGSKNGTKYHFVTCPGASQIKEENKVFFDSFASARAAGYEPAANCPGLE